MRPTAVKRHIQRSPIPAAQTRDLLCPTCWAQPLFLACVRVMEGILLDTMFDLPSLEGVKKVVISKQVVEGTARPLYIYADRADRTGDASASA